VIENFRVKKSTKNFQRAKPGKPAKTATISLLLLLYSLICKKAKWS